MDTTNQTNLAYLQSANRRRKNTERKLKRVRKESQASIQHWKDAATYWQKIAQEYAVKYRATLDINEKGNMKEALKISAMLLPFEMQRAWMAGSIHTDTANRYGGFASQIKK